MKDPWRAAAVCRIGCPAGAGGRRRQRGEATKDEEGDATPDLLLKHPDATLVTFVERQNKPFKHAPKTLAKTSKNT
jgi:hypothetical protein